MTGMRWLLEELEPSPPPRLLVDDGGVRYAPFPDARGACRRVVAVDGGAG